MSTLIRILCLALLLAVMHPAVAATPEPPVIVVLGDSLSAGYGIEISEGWVNLLSQRLASEGYGYRVINASVSGETTQGGLARLPRVLSAHQPRVVVIELGGNDGLRGLPLQVSRANLAKAIELARGARARVLLVGMMIPPNYGPKYGDQFRDMFTSLAKQYSVPFVPFLLDGVALHPDLMQSDGIHANARGQPKLLENVWPKLKPMLVAPGKPSR